MVIPSEEVQDVDEIQVLGAAGEAAEVVSGDAAAAVVVPEDRADIPEVEV
jgi:hypothetical protein